MLQISHCVNRHLEDALAEAIRTSDVDAIEALMEARRLIDNNAVYADEEFDTHADQALCIARTAQS